MKPPPRGQGRPTATLRARVAAGFALFGLAVSLALGAWLYLASRDLEQRLIDEALSAEIQDYQARLARNPHSLPPDTAIIRGFVGRAGDDTAVPEDLRSLSEGRYTREIGGVSYRVAVRAHLGRTLYMLHDRTQVVRRDRRFVLILVVGMTLVSLIAAGGGWWLAGRVIAPVRELAERVRGRDAADPLEPTAAGLPDDEVGELARTIERYLARLRAFVERERAFVGAASHELRTPLAVIQSTVEVLLSDDALGASTRARVERIARATRGMSDLTEALLMLARERPGEGARQGPCAVEEVLEDLVELHRPLLVHKAVGLVLHVEARPALPVARPLLAIALGNLIRNACMYTERGQVTLTLLAGEVRVSDTGPGIGAEDLRCIFDPRGEACRGRGVRGAGIGLPLVQRIAERQGWQLLAQSREGEGSTFTLRFGDG